MGLSLNLHNCGCRSILLAVWKGDFKSTPQSQYSDAFNVTAEKKGIGGFYKKIFSEV